MNDPRILAIFSVVFALLGVYNIYLGRKRMREAQIRGQRIKWYRQINLLTGIEYILLALVFLLSLSIRYKFLPSSLNSIVVPFYLLVLLITAVMAGLVIRQAFLNSRRSRRKTVPQAQAVENNGTTQQPVDKNFDALTREERTSQLVRRRSRRRNAAAARRRKAGKA